MKDDIKLTSTDSLCGLENADIRNVIKAMGYSDDDLTTKRPAIGIANSWNTLIPGHFNFNQISEQVKKGIHRAGGTVFEFGVIGLCDAIAKNNFNYGPGFTKFIWDQRSVREFSTGVPVSTILWSDLSSVTAWYSFESGFLIIWLSSRMI